MSFLGRVARAALSFAGKTLLYAGTAATAITAAVGSSPNRDDAVEVVRSVAPATYESRSGSIIYDPAEFIPCYYGCSGSIIVPAEPLPQDPAIPNVGPIQGPDMSIFFEDSSRSYEPSRDLDPSSLPPSLDTSGIEKLIEIVTVANPESAEYDPERYGRTKVDYGAAVPKDRLLIQTGTFRQIVLLEFPWVSGILTAIPSNAIPSNVLAQDTLLHLVPLDKSGAIPSNAIPSNAIPSNLWIWGAIPSNALPSNYRQAIPSNYGIVLAIPSNLTEQDLRDLGAKRIPSAIPSNMTRDQLLALGIPSNAIPSNAIPSNAIPSNAIPSNAIPSNLVVIDLSKPDFFKVPMLGIDVTLEKPALVDLQLQTEIGMETIGGQIFKSMACDGSCTRSGSIIVDSSTHDSGFDWSSLASLFKRVGSEILKIFSSRSSDRVQMAYEAGSEQIQLPYRTGREQAPPPPAVGVEIVEVPVGPSVGVETVSIGPEMACTEDLSGVTTQIGSSADGGFRMMFVLGGGQGYQTNDYRLWINDRERMSCSPREGDPRRLACVGDWPAMERWLDMALKQAVTDCVVWEGQKYLCPSGETYRAPTSWWEGGCCTTACWCKLSGDTEAGCWNSCPGCPP